MKSETTKKKNKLSQFFHHRAAACNVLSLIPTCNKKPKCYFVYFKVKQEIKAQLHCDMDFFVIFYSKIT